MSDEPTPPAFVIAVPELPPDVVVGSAQDWVRDVRSQLWGPLLGHDAEPGTKIEKWAPCASGCEHQHLVVLEQGTYVGPHPERPASFIYTRGGWANTARWVDGWRVVR